LAAERLWAPGYREWLPPAGLRDALACFWVSVTPWQAPGLAAVLPDGCTDLIWQSGLGAYLAGPDTGPAPTELPPGTIIVGARFWPGAGGPAFRVPLAELRDQRVNLADLMAKAAKLLPPDLTPDQALGEVSRLATELTATGPPDRLVLRATRLLASGRANVVQLCPELAVSERQLRRRFDATVGYGPKMMHRVLRFRHVIAQLSEPGRPLDLAQLAVQAGYADQAHLTRETTKLAGQAPAALARSYAAAARSTGSQSGADGAEVPAWSRV
jgi:AraC-like DNA-binding protein